MPPGLPIGGKTPIVDLRIADGEYIVVIPAQLAASGKIGAIQRGKERRQREAAKGGLSNTVPAPPTCGVAELQDAIRVVNTVKEHMGDALVLSIEHDRLRAIIELG